MHIRIFTYTPQEYIPQSLMLMCLAMMSSAGQVGQFQVASLSSQGCHNHYARSLFV